MTWETTHAARPPVIVIAGPTASGKSALALSLAQELSGEVINADSMQVYRDLRVLTARPSPEEEAAVPHRLYGQIDAAERHSAGIWREQALAAIETAYQTGRRPIVTGGTGFYIETLTHGLSPMPEVPLEVISHLVERAEFAGLPKLFQELMAADPVSAARIGPTDRQRVVRALAVMRSTGRPLSEWQQHPPVGPPFRVQAFWLSPPRDVLYERCNQRLEAMLAAGALAEVEALLARRLDPALPAMKALGVAELAAYLRGKMQRAEAVDAAQQATRRFAKRQLTWFRNRLGNAERFDAQFSERLICQILKKIRGES